ncbi:hypothetical protein HYW99_02780 [Candidatus Woesearchaeota archaeon]|nr:hypothetical protein [Candidatus Woesearchaeota archaeon]
MLNQNFDDRLLRLLEKEVLREKWKKKLKIAGIVIKKRISKKGSFILTIKTRKSEYDIVVPEHKKDEFELAKCINEGDIIKVIGDKQIGGIIFCDRIERLSKNSFNEKQIRLMG